MQSLIRTFIRENILLEKRSATLSAQNMNDISQALNWLRLNKLLVNAGCLALNDSGKHTVTISFKGKKQNIIDVIKTRFGSFIDVA